MASHPLKIDLFLPTKSQYGVLQDFTYALHEALQEEGVESRVLVADKSNPRPFLDKIFEKKPDFTLSFNGLLPDSEGNFFSDMLKIPHIAYIVDAPNHYMSLASSSYSIIATIDELYAEFYRKLNMPNVLFLPHGANKKLYHTTEVERNIDVLALFSFLDYEAIRESWKQLPRPLELALIDAAEEVLSEKYIFHIDAFIEALNRHGLNTQSLQGLDGSLIALLDQLEDYIKGRDRIALLKAIKSSKVQLYTMKESIPGWKKYLKDNSNISIHEELSFEQALEKMRNSKLVLNSCAAMKENGHERVFNGLLQGANVLSNANPYLDSNFEKEEGVFFYRSGHMEEIDQQVQSILNNKNRTEVAKRGQQKVLKEHTWNMRAKSLKSFLEKAIVPSNN